MLAPLLALPLAFAPQDASAAQAPPSAQPAPASKQSGPKPTFSYSFIEAAYFRSNIDNVSQDAEGWGIRASYDVVPGVNLIGAFKTQSTDLLGGDLEVTDYAFGIGTHHAVHQKVDLFGSMDFRWQDRKALGVSSDDTGYGFTGGMRTMPHERIELGVVLGYSYVSTSNTELDFNARGYITEKVSLGASVAFGDDQTAYTLGLRVNI